MKNNIPIRLILFRKAGIMFWKAIGNTLTLRETDMVVQWKSCLRVM